MRKILILPLIVLIVAGCVQQPTGKFLQSQNYSADCSSDWNCTEWSSCVRNDSYSGIQIRTCVDVNDCNSSYVPQESRICGLPRMTVKEPMQMSLDILDLPDDRNWSVSDTNMVSVDESSPSEKEMGFQKGYYVHYLSSDRNDFVHVYNYVSIYPLVDSVINMTYTFESAQNYYRIGDFYENTDKKIASISELGNPLLGDYSVAYNITVVDGSGRRRNLYTICFTKWDVADVFTMEGTNISYDSLKDIAKKAETRIG
jgi:hypothetical protein